jgi:hypothetical protein
MIAEIVNTHAHGDVHLVVLAHLRRMWSLSGRDGFGTLSQKCSSLFLVDWTLASRALDAGPSIQLIVQRGAQPVLVTDASDAEKGVSTKRVMSASGVSNIGSC